MCINSIETVVTMTSSNLILSIWWWRWPRNKSLFQVSSSKTSSVLKIQHFGFPNCHLAWHHDTKLFGWKKCLCLWISAVWAFQLHRPCFVLMLISLSSLATTSKFQRNICFKMRAVGLININTKECKSGHHLWKWSIRRCVHVHLFHLMSKRLHR